jgi:hypothetical protein
MSGELTSELQALVGPDCGRPCALQQTLPPDYAKILNVGITA